MEYQFKNTVLSTSESVHVLSVPDLALSLGELLPTIAGVNTNRGGRKCEITSYNSTTLATLCADGLDINGEHLSFEPAYTSELKISFNNVPVEVGEDPRPLLDLMKLHGCTVTSIQRNYVTVKGHRFANGFIQAVVQPDDTFTPLPTTIKAFDGRTIGVRHKGQPTRPPPPPSTNAATVEPSPLSVEIAKRMAANDSAKKRVPLMGHRQLAPPQVSTYASVTDPWQVVPPTSRTATPLVGPSVLGSVKQPPTKPATSVAETSLDDDMSGSINETILPPGASPEFQAPVVPEQSSFLGNKRHSSTAKYSDEGEVVRTRVVKEGDIEVRLGNFASVISQSQLKAIDDRVQSKKSLTNDELLKHYIGRSFKRDGRLDKRLTPNKFTAVMGTLIEYLAGDIHQHMTNRTLIGEPSVPLAVLHMIEDQKSWAELKATRLELLARFSKYRYHLDNSDNDSLPGV